MTARTDAEVEIVRAPGSAPIYWAVDLAGPDAGRQREPTQEERAAAGWAHLPNNEAMRTRLARVGGKVVIHSSSEPAVLYKDGAKSWSRNNRLHRDDDLPAMEEPDGRRKWYRDGKLHREGDLPAVESARLGVWEWYLDDRRHREGGPAVICAEPAGGTRLEWWHWHRDYTEGMEYLLAAIRKPGRLLSLEATLKSGQGVFSVRSADGEEVASGAVQCAGWVPWIIENREQYFLELAASMRAEAMRKVMGARPSQSCQPGPARRARPVTL